MTYEEYAKIRDSKGFTDYKIAKETGISRTTLSAWKKGSYTPKEDKIRKIIDVLGYSVLEAGGWREDVPECIKDDLEWITLNGNLPLAHDYYFEKEIELVAKSYADAPEAIKAAVCKLLDIERVNLPEE